MMRQQSNRHCMVVHAYYPLAETRVQRQAEALVEHGVQVDVICLCLPNEPAEELVRGVQVYRLPVGTVNQERGVLDQLIEYLHFFILAWFKLNQLYRQNRYDVIQVHNLPDFLAFCALWPKLCGAAVILDIHDLMPELFAARTGRSMNHILVRLVTWQEQLSCRFADHVITVTELWRQVLISRGLPIKKTSVVMNMADSSLFHPQISDHQSIKSRNGFHLIYHGVQTARHGLDTLLHAVAQVRPQIPSILVTLHGEGEYHDQLVGLAHELNLSDCVHFSDRYIPVTELPALIVQADVGVVPYRRDVFMDGILPTKLMEYVSLGMPVIASRTPVIEAYLDDNMVQFFTPDDMGDLAGCLLRLYTDPTRCTQLIEGTAIFRERYSWTKISAAYVDTVERLASK